MTNIEGIRLETAQTQMTQGASSNPVKKEKAIDLASEISGTKKTDEVKADEKEKAEVEKFEKEVKKKKASKFLSALTFVGGAVVGVVAACAIMVAVTGVATGAAIVMPAIGGGALAMFIRETVIGSKYEDTLKNEEKRRTDNLIDKKTEEPKSKGIDKTLTTSVPVWNGYYSDPDYSDVGIYNDKSGNAKVVKLTPQAKEFNTLLEGFSTDNHPDVKSSELNDFSYKMKALFLKSATPKAKEKANQTFDELIKKYTAENSAGGKDLTKDELVAIREDMQAAF